MFLATGVLNIWKSQYYTVLIVGLAMYMGPCRVLVMPPERIDLMQLQHGDFAIDMATHIACVKCPFHINVPTKAPFRLGGGGGSSARNKDQKLVGCFLKIGYFIGYYTAVP